MAEDTVPEHEQETVTAQGDRIEIEENVPSGQEASIKSQKADSRKWVSFGALVLGAGTIYKLGFLKDAFYVPMQEVMGLSHTEIGFATSIAGLISTFGFLAAIYISDRFSKKIMIPLSLIVTGLVGLYISGFPSFTGFLLAYCVLAVCADMLFWPVMLKTVRLLGDENQQGRMFGILEAGRGLIDTIVAFTALGIFSWLGEGSRGLRGGILFYSIVPIVTGIVAYFSLEHDVINDTNEKGEKVGKNRVAFDGMIQALKNRNIWLVALNVFMVYSIYCGLTYFIPFLKDIYGLPVVLVGAYGIINQYGLKMLGGPIGGYIADKVTHSATRYIQIVFLLTFAALVTMTMLPHKSMNVYMGMAMTLMTGAFVFSMRAVFFAPMEEIKVKREITGAAMSLGSFIGYLPGAFLYTVYGAILDANPGMAGYKYVMICMAGFAVVGFFICSWLLRVVKNSPVGNDEQERVS